MGHDGRTPTGSDVAEEENQNPEQSLPKHPQGFGRCDRSELCLGTQ